MDNFNCTFGYMMGQAMIMVAYCTFAAFIEKMLKAEREKVKASTGPRADPGKLAGLL